MSDSHADYLTAKQAAEMLGLTVATVRGWCRRGELGGVLRLRSGRSWYYRVPRGSVLARLEVVRPQDDDAARGRGGPAAARLPVPDLEILARYGLRVGGG